MKLSKTSKPVSDRIVVDQVIWESIRCMKPGIAEVEIVAGCIAVVHSTKPFPGAKKNRDKIPYLPSYYFSFGINGHAKARWLAASINHTYYSNSPRMRTWHIFTGNVASILLRNIEGLQAFIEQLGKFQSIGR